MRGRGVPHAAIMCAGRACNLLIRNNKSWHRFQSPEGGRLGLQHVCRQRGQYAPLFQSPEGGRLGLQPAWPTSRSRAALVSVPRRGQARPATPRLSVGQGEETPSFSPPKGAG